MVKKPIIFLVCLMILVLLRGEVVIVQFVFEIGIEKKGRHMTRDDADAYSTQQHLGGVVGT